MVGGPTSLNITKKHTTICLQFLKSFEFLDEVEAGILFFPSLLLPDSK